MQSVANKKTTLSICYKIFSQINRSWAETEGKEQPARKLKIKILAASDDKLCYFDFQLNFSKAHKERAEIIILSPEKFDRFF